MNISRGIARWMCRFFISAALSTWIIVATLQATVLDRTVVKNWLNASGIYNNGLQVQMQASLSGGDTSLITSDMLQKALAETFDANYLRTNVNTVIDSTYDWLEGKTQTITFSIPVQTKAQIFAQNLAAQLTPKLAALQVCKSRIGNTDSNHITCLPGGVSAADYANRLTESSDGNGFLALPLTQDTLKGQGNAPQLGWLPSAVQWAHTLFYALPALIIALGGAFVALETDKLLGASRLGRQLAVSAVVTLIGGLFLWYVGTSIDLSSAVASNDPKQSAAIAASVNSLARTILPDVGRTLSLYGGIVVAIGGGLWGGAALWRARRDQRTQLSTRQTPTTAAQTKQRAKTS